MFRLKTMRTKRNILFFAFISIAARLMGQDVLMSDSSFPFNQIGEELEYALKWGPFKVGSGYLRVLPITNIGEEECYHVSLEVKTNSFADAVYKVRSHFDSFVSTSLLKPVLYEIHQHEGSTNRDAKVVFDWNALTVQYQREGEEPKNAVAIEDNTWDPLSVVYYFRKVLSPDDDVVYLPATDGKKFIQIEVKSLSLTKLKSQMGENLAMVVEPDTKEMKGVFQKSNDSNITMWYSYDEKRFPLLIRSKVIVGSFNAEMKKARLLGEAEHTD